MALLFRISRRAFAPSPNAPFDGEAAYRGGSRWSAPGQRMSFASSTVTLAMLEYLVHIDWRDTSGDDLVLVSASLDDACIHDLHLSDLPEDWRRVCPSNATRRLGDEWLSSQQSVALSVPSVAAPIERNYLINPNHLQFDRLVVGSIAPFSFDLAAP